VKCNNILLSQIKDPSVIFVIAKIGSITENAFSTIRKLLQQRSKAANRLSMYLLCQWFCALHFLFSWGIDNTADTGKYMCESSVRL